jgi:TPR repeat protein
MVVLNSSSAAVYAAAVTAAAGFIGSWIGAQLALSSFKRQRAFDKQLDWYERADRYLQEMIEKIDIALTFQEQPGIPAADLKGHWAAVQGAHLKIDRIGSQGAFFASAVAAEQISSAADLVQKVADKTEAFDPPFIKDGKNRDEALKLIATLPNKLRKMEKPLIVEARRHLGFDTGGFLVDSLVVLWKWSASVFQRLASLFHRG